MACHMKPEGYGLIVRTEAEGVEEELIRNDLNFILQKVQGIVKKEKNDAVPALIYDGASPVEFAVRELLKQSVQKVITDDPDIYRTVEELLGWSSPEMNPVKVCRCGGEKLLHDKSTPVRRTEQGSLSMRRIYRHR